MRVVDREADEAESLAAAGARAPLIVTATLPPPVHAWADALRRAHFPPERNVLSAHVTLFHALPPFAQDEAKAVLADLAKRTAPVAARLERVMDLGRGTAFAISSPDLLVVRAEIAERFHGLLTQQDQQKPRLHVTVQNKVTTAEARTLQRELAEVFIPRDFAFAGLELHFYRGGPWEAAGRWAFRGKAR
ncbi:2'-5' RNA ligase family protein [Novosphingobium sp. KCTC 2891]|uniref:2'-5' RNA ligase family protein n=1 Tax=Novosphingobium sp. KCTC 2891 TaxID=2989730 RepID=UPI002223B027|nr:2'-5' RNA ligase family protein [Novosphingobium sp. KCTC 2891]MCW1382864.1 2'-5' RNA ligase family protein [Novosphingobium sp. KCTC 2891]